MFHLLFFTYSYITLSFIVEQIHPIEQCLPNFHSIGEVFLPLFLPFIFTLIIFGALYDLKLFKSLYLFYYFLGQSLWLVRYSLVVNLLKYWLVPRMSIHLFLFSLKIKINTFQILWCSSNIHFGIGISCSYISYNYRTNYIYFNNIQRCLIYHSCEYFWNISIA